MKNKKYSIIYSSLTGNTKVLADAIHEALPQDECEYFGVSDTVIPSSELLYIGFWTDKGNADTKTLQLLSQLKNKQIFLFGTAGFGGSDIYFRKILSQVKQFIDASNVIVGEYMCQGRMPQSVRERYLKMKEAPDPVSYTHLDVYKRQGIRCHGTDNNLDYNGNSRNNCAV